MKEHGIAADEFDPEADFAQFLEEAKTHVNDKQQQPSYEQRFAKNEQSNETTEKKKSTTSHHKKPKSSWKNALFPFRTKGDRKSKSDKPPPLAAALLTSADYYPAGNPSRPRRRESNSGPMYRDGLTTNRKGWKSVSGPIINLFGSNTKKGGAVMEEDNEIDQITMPPYTSLAEKVDKRSNGGNHHAYGPVYLVT